MINDFMFNNTRVKAELQIKLKVNSETKTTFFPFFFIFSFKILKFTNYIFVKYIFW